MPEVIDIPQEVQTDGPGDPIPPFMRNKTHGSLPPFLQKRDTAPQEQPKLSEEPVPKVNGWDFKQTPMMSAQEYNQMTPLPKTEDEKKHEEQLNNAQANLKVAWNQNIDNVVKDHIIDQQKNAETEQRMNLHSDNTSVNTYIPKAIRDMDEKQKRESISQNEIDHVKNTADNRFLVHKLISKAKSEGKEQEAKSLAASSYLMDSKDRAVGDNVKRINDNAKKIENGELIYNTETGDLVKPVNGFEAVKNGYKQRTADYQAGYDLASMDKSKGIEYLEGQMKQLDPDNPEPMHGSLAEKVGSEGLMFTKGALAAGVTGLFTKNPALSNSAAVAATADEVGMRSFANEAKRTYAQVKQQLQYDHPGMPEDEIKATAYDKAIANGKIAAAGDIAMTGLMTYSGLKLGREPLNVDFGNSFKSAVKAASKGAIKTAVKGAPEGFANAGIASGIQETKNALSEAQGIHRDLGEGALDAGEGMLWLHYGIAAAAHTLHAVPKIIQGLSSKPPEIVNNAIHNMVQEGSITPEQGGKVLADVQSHQAKDAQIPSNVTDSEARLHIQDNLDKINDNNSKMSKPEEGGLHESFHAPIKDENARLEWENNMLAAKPEDQIKILKDKKQELESNLADHNEAKQAGKPGKLDYPDADRGQLKAVTKKLDEVQAKLDDPLYKAAKVIGEGNIKGFSKDILEEAAANDHEKLKSYLKDISEQLHDPNSRETAIDTYGKKLSGMIEEMYPKPEPVAEPIPEPSRISVIRPEDNKPPEEAITIKPNADAIPEQTTGEMGLRQQDAVGKTVGTGDDGSEIPPTKDSTEINQNQGEEKVTGIKNAVTLAEREGKGLGEVEVQARRDFGEVFEKGKSAVDKGEIDPRLLAKEMAQKARPMTPEESAAMIYDRMRLQNEHKDVMEAIEKARSEGNDVKVDLLKSHLNEVEENIGINDEAARKTGYEQGLGLAARKMMIKEDYSLANQMQRYKNANEGKDLTPEVRAKLEGQTKKLDEALKKIEEHEKTIAQLKAQKEVDAAAKGKKSNASKDYKKERKDIFDSIKKKWKDAGNDGTLTAVPVPYAKQLAAISPDVARLLKSYAEQGIVKLADIVKDIHDELVANVHADITEKDTIDLIAGVYKEKKAAPVLDRAAMTLRANVEKIKNQIDAEKEKIRLSNRTKGQKSMDFFQKWRRAMLLSGVKVLGKLGSAATTRGLAVTPLESLVGEGLKRVPGLKQIARGAPREGSGFNPKAEAKALTQWVDKMTYKDIGETLKGGKGELDYLYSGKVYPPSDFMDFFGQLHAAIKTIPKRSEFFRSFELRAQHAAKAGKDLTDPFVQQEIGVAAYGDAMRSIFMQENYITSAYKAIIRTLEDSKIEGSSAAAEVMKFMFPIVKVPTNYVAEETSYMIGGLKAAYALRNGIKELTPDQKDFVMRAFKKQTIGAAFILLGYFNPSNFGGYYMGKRNSDDLQSGDIELFGIHLPHWATHTPLLEALQLGATLRRVQDRENQRYGADANALTGIPTAVKGIAEQVPFFGQGSQISTAFGSLDGTKKYLFRLGQSLVEPQLIKEIAEFKDTDAQGKAIKRDPETFIEQLETGIPGLRETIKAKGGKGGGGAGATGHYKKSRTSKPI